MVPPGVKVGGLRLGGMPVEQARAALSWSYNRPIRFVFYGHRWRIRPAKLGATVDVEKTIGRALKANPREDVPLSIRIDRALRRRGGFDVFGFLTGVHGRARQTETRGHDHQQLAHRIDLLVELLA